MNFADWTGLDLELCGRLCLVLAHSLWQFALLAGLAAVVSRAWKNATPEQLYALYASVLLLGLISLPITFALTRLPGESLAMGRIGTAPQQQIVPPPNSSPMQEIPAKQVAPPPSVADALPESPSIAQVSYTTDLLSWTPWFVACYVAGVTVMLLRLLRGLWQNYRLSTTASPLTSGQLNEILRDLTNRWALRVAPALAITERVIVPQVVGLWRPTILLPAAARTPAEPQPGKRPVRDVHLAFGDAAVMTDAEGRWSLDNVPTNEELFLSDQENKSPYSTPLRLRFSHPDYETIDGIEDWQTVWNPPLEQLRDGTARTVMKWIDKKDHARVNAVRLEQREQYRSADFSGRHFKGQNLMTWSDNVLADAKLADSTWEDMTIPGMSRLLYEADLSNSVSGREAQQHRVR